MFLSFVKFVFAQDISSADLHISAKSAIVMSVGNGEVLWQKNAHEKLSMASTTKIMSSIIACDYISQNGDVLVEITDEMLKTEGSSMGLLLGDKILLSNLVVGMLLPSGNDAANSVAFTVAGNLEDFAVLMNEKAKEIGMTQSNFVTASGLDSQTHYSTAYDMAKLACLSKKYPLIVDIMKSASKEITYYSAKYQKEISITLHNHNKLLSLYEFCDGGKTGYTKKSGRTLVSTATKNNTELVAITLNAADDWNDHIKMYENAFSKFEEVAFPKEIINIPTAEGFNVNLDIEECIIQTLGSQKVKQKVFLPKFIYYSSYKNGDVIGEAVYYIDEKEVLRKDILKK